jgi:DNA-binding IclR family transcriptional regulator
MRVLDFFAAHPDEDFTISELARRLELNKATCHSIVSALVAQSYLARHDENGRYQLGPALIPIGEVARRRYRVLDAAAPALQLLADEFDVVVAASIRAGRDLLHIARFGTETIFTASIRPGLRIPLVPPVGASFFAWLPHAEVEEWLGTLDDSPPGIDAYRQSLARVRRDGYVATRDLPSFRAFNELVGSTDPDIDAGRHEAEDGADLRTYLHDVTRPGADPTYISAPVFDSKGRPELIVTVQFAPGAEARLPRLVSRLLEVTTRMTLASGGRTPVEHFA